MIKNIYITVFFISLLFSNVENYINQINKHVVDKEYNKAKDLFNTSIAEYDASASLYFIGSQICILLDQLDDANKYLIKAIELDNKNNDYRSKQEELVDFKTKLLNARKTFDKGNYDQSISEHLDIIKLFPNNAIVYYNLGKIYKFNKNYELAIDNYRKAISINPFEQKYSKSIKAIAQEMASAGDINYRRQEFDTAINDYKKAIDYYPEYTTAIFKLARTYYRLKDYENTKKYLEKNLNIDTNQEQSHKMLGDIYRKYGDYENAVKHYKLSVSINPNYSKAFYSLGTLMLSKSKLNKAKEYLTKATEIDINYDKAFGALGKVETELKNYDLAIKYYNSALNINPKQFEIHYRLSSLYNEMKNYQKAKESSKKCLNIKRNYSPAFFELGISEKALGNKVAALDAFENAKRNKDWRKSAQFEIDMINKGL